MTEQRRFWPTLWRLLLYGKPWRTTLALACLLLWAAAAAEVTGPVLISYFIDNLLAKRTFSAVQVIGLAAVFIILQLLAAVLHYKQGLLFSQVAVGAVQRLRTDVMGAVLHQPLSTFDTQSGGQILSRLTNDTEVVKDLWVVVLATWLRSGALISAMLVAMFMLNWRMACIAVVIFPLVLLVMLIYQHYSVSVVRRAREYLAQITHCFNEAINGMNVIQQFRQQRRFGERLREVSQHHYLARMQTLRLDGFLLRPLLSLFSAVILCGLMLLFSFSSANAIDVGVLYAFISYLGRLNEPLIEMTTQQSILQQAVIAGERIFVLMDLPAQRFGEDRRPLASGQIDIRGLSFCYRPSEYVLHNINLHIPHRGFVALVGHSGSGKSTLAGLLSGYYPVTEGEILLDGRPLRELSHDVRCRGVAIVQQNPVVLADSFFANVSLDRSVTESAVWQALETVQLAPLVRGLKKGLHSRLDEQGNNLSTGQKQLLAMARVLVASPQVLILDEATAYIDSQTERAIQQAMQAIRRHTTLIVIAHRLSTITDADRIVLLHQGRLTEQGTHTQLLAKRGRYWQMYQLQMTGDKLAAEAEIAL